MAYRTFTKEEIFELSDIAHEEGNPDWFQSIATRAYKHGVMETFVVASFKDSVKTYWKFDIYIHPQEGWQFYGDVRAVEVKPQEKTIIEWVEVK